jgi:hypothetical protein
VRTHGERTPEPDLARFVDSFLADFERARAAAAFTNQPRAASFSEAHLPER